MQFFLDIPISLISNMNFDQGIKFDRSRQCPRIWRNLHAILKAYIICKAGESQGRALEQACYYTLRPPIPLGSRVHDHTFYQDFGPP